MSEIVKHDKFYEGQGGGTVENEPKGKFTDPTVSEPVQQQNNTPIADDFVHPVAVAKPEAIVQDETVITLNHSRSIVGHNLALAVTAGHKRKIVNVRAWLDGSPVYDKQTNQQRVEWNEHSQGTGGPGESHVFRVWAADDAGDTSENSIDWTDEE